MTQWLNDSVPQFSLMHLHMQMRRKARHRGEDGYVLLTLLLIVALMIIFAAAITPSITFEIKRDREEEMIHRGVQYSRAIKAYYKKFGRYPTKIEDLESANRIRFLRKRYKDPITGKDFKLLHFGDVKLALSGGIGGGLIPGATPIGGAPGGLSGAGGLVQPGAFAGNSGLGAASNSPFGQNPQTNNTPQETDTSQSSSSEPGSNAPGTEGGSDNSGGSSSADQPGSTLGGGAIVGVASISKKETIREFNNKKKYSEWQFIYDPGTDRGGLLMTPNQPVIMGFGQQVIPNVNGPSSSGFGSGFGAASSFGTGTSGMQNNPNSPTPGGFGTPNPPSNPPQQPQQQQ